MKRIVYSGFLKTLAVILLIASIVLGVLIGTNGVITFCAEKEEIYSFERSFSESWYISHLLGDLENVLFNAYHTVYRGEIHNGKPVYQSEASAKAALEANIKLRFEDYYNSDKINYFVQWNDLVFTNCGAKAAEELVRGSYYSYLRRDATGNIWRETSGNSGMMREYLLEYMDQYDKTSTIIVSCNINEDTVAEYKAIWEKQEAIVIDTVVRVLACVVAALLLFVYLICVCGKNKNGEHKGMWLDNVWLEVHLAAILSAGIGAVALCMFAIESYVYGHFSLNLIYLVLGLASVLGSLVILTSTLSIVRNIKARRLIESSGILQVVRWAWRLVVKIIKWIWRHAVAFWRILFRLLSKKTGVLCIAVLFAYTVIMAILGASDGRSPLPLFLAIVLFGFACFVVAYRTKDFDEIKKGVGEIRNGNVAYKIPPLKTGDLKPLAANINDIAQGLDESVSAKVKAERLKTELITNVSHDLKTPITSIISYTELLSKIEDLPEEARDYIAVIAKKSDRLRKLTQDLFDISKVQSGNENVVLEKLDVSLLINQALGEHDNEILSAGLPFCVDAPKELFIFADGRKMSRVLSNLISNILKYSLKGTRVFITAAEKDGMIEMAFKNISAYPLTFNVEEITQRFVRGDESRTAEGNGLGLAIAKSYTEICNGTFEVAADGDMFKVFLRFKKFV